MGQAPGEAARGRARKAPVQIAPIGHIARMPLQAVDIDHRDAHERAHQQIRRGVVSKLPDDSHAVEFITMDYARQAHRRARRGRPNDVNWNRNGFSEIGLAELDFDTCRLPQFDGALLDDKRLSSVHGDSFRLGPLLAFGLLLRASLLRHHNAEFVQVAVTKEDVARSDHFVAFGIRYDYLLPRDAHDVDIPLAQRCLAQGLVLEFGQIMDGNSAIPSPPASLNRCLRSTSGKRTCFSMSSMMAPATSAFVAYSTPSKPGDELTSIT